jgi:hypothetical protein
MLQQRGRLVEANGALRASAEVWRLQEIGWAEGRALLYLSNNAGLLQDLELSYRSALRALELLDPCNDAPLYAEGLGLLAVAAWYERRYDDMRALLDQIEAIARTTWLPNSVLLARYRAELAIEQRDLATARALLGSLPKATSLHARAEHGFTELQLLVAERSWEQAERNAAWRAEAYRETGYVLGEAVTLTWRALVAAATGDLPAARRWSDLALGLLDSPVGVGRPYGELAQVAPLVAAIVTGDQRARPALLQGLARVRALAPLGPTTGSPALPPDIRLAVSMIEEVASLA